MYECQSQCRSTKGTIMNMLTFPSTSVSLRGFCWQVRESETFSVFITDYIQTIRFQNLSLLKWCQVYEWHMWVFPDLNGKNRTLNFLLFGSVLSWSGLLYKAMELKGRPLTEDHPITPPSCKWPHPKHRLLLQVRRLQWAPWPAHGCRTRSLLLPVQHRLPWRRGAAGCVLGLEMHCVWKYL